MGNDNYRQELAQKLEAAQKRVRQGREFKALKESAPSLFEIIDTEITMEVNKGYSETPLGYEQYLESHGAVRGLKRIRNVIDSKEAEAETSSQEVQAIQNALGDNNEEQ